MNLDAKRTEYETALQQCITQEAALLEQLAQVRTRGQQLQGALAALRELAATDVQAPNRAARRRAKGTP